MQQSWPSSNLSTHNSRLAQLTDPQIIKKAGKNIKFSNQHLDNFFQQQAIITGIIKLVLWLFHLVTAERYRACYPSPVPVCPTLITLTMMPGSMLVLVWRLQPDWWTLFCPPHPPPPPPSPLTSHHHVKTGTEAAPARTASVMFPGRTLLLTNTYYNEHLL